jgi:acyl dehydratase
MSKLELSPYDWKDYIGKEVGISDWYEVTQEEITEYGKITDDMQWIHTDPNRAKKESPYETTIAHGNWLISIVVPKLLFQIYLPINTGMIINYGWNKIRFPAPAPVGKRIRSNMKVTDVREIENDAYDVVFEMTITVEGESKPCCVASKITRYYSS